MNEHIITQLNRLEMLAESQRVSYFKERMAGELVPAPLKDDIVRAWEVN